MTQHDCHADRTLRRVLNHPAACSDWSGPRGSQGYSVHRCDTCGVYWGCRYQYDPGTGSDDHWRSFGRRAADVERHY